MATPIPAFVSQYIPSTTDTAQVTGGTLQTLTQTLWYYYVSNRTTASNGRSLLYGIKLALEASLAGTTWTLALSSTSPFKLQISHSNGSSRTITWGSTLQTALGLASTTTVVAASTTVTADYPSPFWWTPDMPISMTGPSLFDPTISYGVPTSAGNMQRAPDMTVAAVSNGVQWAAEYVFNGVQYYYKARKQSGYTNLDLETWWSNGPRKGRRLLMWRDRSNATGSSFPSAGSASPYRFIEYAPQPGLQSTLPGTNTTPNNPNYYDVRLPLWVTENGESVFADSPPGSPIAWFDAQDIDLSANSTLADGAAVGTWKNKGSLGTGADIVQATGSAKPTYRLVGSSGKCNNKSSVQFDGGDVMQSAAFSSQAQPVKILCVFIPITGSGDVVYDGGPAGGEMQMSLNTAGGRLTVFYAGGFYTTLANVADAANKSLCVYNGAGSTARINGVAASGGNVGSNALTRVTLGGNSTPTASLIGHIYEYVAWQGASAPSDADIETYIDGKYGTTWSH